MGEVEGDLAGGACLGGGGNPPPIRDGYSFGRYASYWNACLLQICFHTEISLLYGLFIKDMPHIVNLNRNVKDVLKKKSSINQKHL